MPIVGFVSSTPESPVRVVAAFRKGLNETGYVEGQNVMVEYHWLEGQYDRLPSLIAGLVRRRVAVIVTPFPAGALAAKAATTTIPIVFGVGEDPVKLGLVASLARPGGNATGFNFFTTEVVAKLWPAMTEECVNLKQPRSSREPAKAKALRRRRSHADLRGGTLTQHPSFGAKPCSNVLSVNTRRTRAQ